MCRKSRQELRSISCYVLAFLAGVGVGVGVAELELAVDDVDLFDVGRGRFLPPANVACAIALSFSSCVIPSVLN